MVSLFDQASLAWEEGDERKAFELFRQAVEQGDRNALLNLGYCYDEGVGTKKNKRKALYWYKKAGESAAYINIAIHYSTIGDFKRAERWYLDALKKGDQSAALGLAKLGLEGKINLSHAKILEYLHMVIEAKVRIGVCESDREEACLLLEQLGERGLNEA